VHNAIIKPRIKNLLMILTIIFTLMLYRQSVRPIVLSDSQHFLFSLPKHGLIAGTKLGFGTVYANEYGKNVMTDMFEQ
jgi:hypothetical protein